MQPGFRLSGSGIIPNSSSVFNDYDKNRTHDENDTLVSSSPEHSNGLDVKNKIKISEIANLSDEFTEKDEDVSIELEN